MYIINDILIYVYYFDRIDVFEGIYVNKTGASKECDIVSTKCIYLPVSI